MEEFIIEDPIELINEDGQVEEFFVIASFGVNDNDYVVLVNVEDEDNEDAYAEILKIEEVDDDETLFVGIDDQDELDLALEVYQELIEEYEEE